MSMSSFGNPKKLPGGYSLDAHLGDTTSYLPIPLRFLRSIEMNGQSGVHGQVMVNATQPCCCGLCGIFGVGIHYIFFKTFIGQNRVDYVLINL